ncbi:MAG TPA: NAD(P)/FAD-dependent oxidoreductase [Vicinamibacterales bacterium]|nr:NAD(P)/FAD-dependent oxidoreductase [Vicinamibacterales bacterium]
MFDAIVAGGGPAGLSAALMLARCRRSVLVCDLGQPRNRRSRALHGFLTRDGISPARLVALGRRELRKYGVAWRRRGVTDARWNGSAFDVSVGGTHEAGRVLVIATGVIDALPAVSGLEECYGRSVFHCPYCDGWEWRDRHLAVLGHGREGIGTALALTTWSGDIVLCTNGNRLARADRERLSRNRVVVRTTAVERLEHRRGRLRAIALAGGERLPCDALFFATGQHPQSDLAVRLGCQLTPRGTVKTGNQCETNVPHLFVVGDASRDAQFVVVAAAEGVKAAVAVNRLLIRRELIP